MITVVFFSSVNCGYCPPVRKMINDLKVDYEDSNVVFTSVELDSEGNNKETFQTWQVSSVPTIVIINRNGNSTAQEVGRIIGSDKITKDNLIYNIESLLTRNE